MAIDKTVIAVFDTVTLVSGSADTYVDIDTSSYLDMVMHVRINNGATGPTVPALVLVTVGFDTNGDGSADIWQTYGGNISGRIVNAGGFSCNVRLPPAAKALRVYAGGNKGQNVTLETWITATVAMDVV
jgi:hypothetical protein